MRAQDLYSASPFHRPRNCLLELFANVKCSTSSADSGSADLNMNFCQQWDHRSRFRTPC